MMVLLVIALIIVAILISNFIVKIKESDKKEVEEKKIMKLKDFLAVVRDLDPEVELDFLLEYWFNSSLDKENKEKIEIRLIAYATNHSYYILKKIIEYEKTRHENLDKIKYLENLILENGFPSITGLSEIYIEYIEVMEIRNYILSLVIKFKKINILKFIEFVESDIMENEIAIFSKDKNTLLKILENNEQNNKNTEK